MPKDVYKHCCVIGCEKQTEVVRAIHMANMKGLVCAIPVCKEHMK